MKFFLSPGDPVPSFLSDYAQACIDQTQVDISLQKLFPRTMMKYVEDIHIRPGVIEIIFSDETAPKSAEETRPVVELSPADPIPWAPVITLPPTVSPSELTITIKLCGREAVGNS